MTLPGWTRFSFTHDGHTRDVYRRGSGPGVLVMHEIPGITPRVEAFARRVADEGYTVFMPDLFGEVGKAPTPPYALGQIARACIRQEFAVLASGGSSPITRMLRSLCLRLHEEAGGPGVGAVGMCLTGNFALALMVDPWLMAPVLSQPSLPFPTTPEARAGLHVSDSDLQVIKRRTRDEKLTVLGLRFTHDPLCPKARFDRLRDELGSGFEGIEIDSSLGNPHGNLPIAHSVLTEHLVDKEGHPTQRALHRVLELFDEKLRKPMREAAAAAPPAS
ncbi:MAG: dienelactone hydrolase family protein [Myxococcales bacterium]|nr:dienelactone hydrolase family protein [Myxococcales bacterium]MCB9630070.1 dienelactone hydrolase family protein [Sandaracinaceae bacterium]